MVNVRSQGFKLEHFQHKDKTVMTIKNASFNAKCEQERWVTIIKQGFEKMV